MACRHCIEIDDGCGLGILNLDDGFRSDKAVMNLRIADSENYLGVSSVEEYEGSGISRFFSRFKVNYCPWCGDRLKTNVTDE